MAVVSRMDPGPPLAALDDSRLVEMACGGDQHAFEQLVERHRGRLLARARRVLPGDRAEDALQTGLLSAWLALQRGTDVQDARPWLERIVHHAALRALPPAVHVELSETIGAPDQDEPAAALDRRQQLRAALAALASLPELQRQALLQTAIEGDSYERAALSLGLTQSTVRGLVHRARTAMRSALGALIPLPGVGRLWGRRAPAAGRFGGAVHPGASMAPGGVGALAAKGAVALVVAAAGVGASHLIAGRGAIPTVAHRAPVGSAPLGSSERTAISAAAAAAHPRLPSKPRARADVQRASAARTAGRSNFAGWAARAADTGMPQADRGLPPAGPAGSSVRGPTPPRSTAISLGPSPVTAKGSPGSAPQSPAPAQAAGPPSSSSTGSVLPPPDSRRGESSASGSDGRGDTPSTGTSGSGTEATTSADTNTAAAGTGQPGS